MAKTKILATYSEPKKIPIADTSNVIYRLMKNFFNIEVSICIARAKSELNLQQLQSFHMLLKMIEITFPRTKLSKFSGEACPRTPLDTPAFARRFFETLDSEIYSSKKALKRANVYPTHFFFSCFFVFVTLHFSIDSCLLSTYDMELNNLQLFQTLQAVSIFISYLLHKHCT